VRGRWRMVREREKRASAAATNRSGSIARFRKRVGKDYICITSTSSSTMHLSEIDSVPISAGCTIVRRYVVTRNIAKHVIAEHRDRLTRPSCKHSTDCPHRTPLHRQRTASRTPPSPAAAK